MTLMLRLLPASLFHRIKSPPRRMTLRSGLAPACAIVVACVAASCGEDSAEPVITTDTTATTTDISSTHTTADTTVDTTGTPTTTGTMSTVDTTTTAGMTTTADTTGTTGTVGTTTSADTTVDTGMPTTTATTSDTTVDTAGPTTTTDTTVVDTSTDTTMVDTTDATPLLTFGEIDYFILGASCANIICHTGTPYFEPVLTNNIGGNLHDTLMTWTVEECDDQPLVVPGDPDNSALLMLVRRECDPIVIETTGEVFESMPPFCTDPICLPQEDYDALVAWINAGAPE